MRAAQQTDFHITVEGVGAFSFGQRAMEDQRRINIEYARYIEDVVPTPWLHKMATQMSTLRVLTVRAPAGWDLDAMDPLDDETYKKIEEVFNALRDKEGSFRKKPTTADPPSGEGAGGVAGVLVPKEVQPLAQ
jgi:hypothetical protein